MLHQSLKYQLKRFIGRERLLNMRRAPYVKLLKGSGIEIGALHSPLIAPHLTVKYVDRMSKAELIRSYPEISPDLIVDTDIVSDAEDLKGVEGGTQDFVIANHVIEHMRNPISALLHWQRVLKAGGRLYLAAPDKERTFDKTRELTTNEHLMADYEDPSRERDYEAFQDFAREVSCKHFGFRPIEESEAAARELESSDYSIHFHVWNYQSFGEFLEFVGSNVHNWKLRVIKSMPTKGEEFIWVLEKLE